MSDTIAAVLTHEPDWTVLPPTTPPYLSRLLKRCLEKDPTRRQRDIGDARLEEDWQQQVAEAQARAQFETAQQHLKALEDVGKTETIKGAVARFLSRSSRLTMSARTAA